MTKRRNKVPLEIAEVRWGGGGVDEKNGSANAELRSIKERRLEMQSDLNITFVFETFIIKIIHSN